MTFNPDNPNEHAEAQDDPYAVASTAAVAPREYYGQIQVDCWFCALVKGQGKVPFDPQQHERRSTCIDIRVYPISEMNLSFELRREMLDWARDWAGIVWPNLKGLGVTSVRDLAGKWCKCSWVSDGRTYRDKAGEERESTTFKFLALYDDEEACRAAYYADTGKQPESAQTEKPTPGFEDAKPAENPKERESAEVFLRSIIQQHKGNMAKIKAWVDVTPMVAKFFGDEEAIQDVINQVYQAA